LPPGLGGARPRTKHPDFVSARPRSQPERLPESPDPHRIELDLDSACARSIGPGCTAVGRRCLRKLTHLFARLIARLARHREIRASFELGRAFPGTLFTFSGVAAGRCVPTDVCTPNQFTFEHPCASCAPDARTTDLHRRLLSFRGLRLVLAPRGVQTRDPLSSEDGRAFIEGLGARRWERGRGIVRFTTHEALGDPIQDRVGVFVRSRARIRMHPWCLCRLLRCVRRSVTDRRLLPKAAKADSTRFLVTGERASPTRDTFHRQEPHARRARAEARTRATLPPSDAERSRDEDRSAPEAPLVPSPE
jgi:hypothetical protein